MMRAESVAREREPDAPRRAASWRPRLRTVTLLAMVACCAGVLAAYRAVVGVDPFDRALADLRRDDAERRRSAANVLGNPLEDRLAEAILALSRTLRDPDLGVRKQAAQSLSILIAAAAARSERRGRNAARQPDTGEAVEAAWAASRRLVAAMGDPDREVRFESAMGLGELGWAAADGPRRPPEERAVLDALAAGLRDPEAIVRERSIQSLGRWRRDGVPSHPEQLLASVKDPDPRVARAAVQWLWATNRVSPEGARAMIEVMREARPDVAIYLTTSLAWPAGHSVAVLDALLDALRDPRDSSKLNAAQVLERLGPMSEEVRARLRAALEDGDPLVRMLAARSLGLSADRMERFVVGAIRCLDLEAAQGTALRSESPAATYAVDLLSRYGPSSESAGEAVAALARHVRRLGPGLRLATVQALGRFGPRAAPAIPELVAIVAERPALGPASPGGLSWPDERVLTAGALGPIASGADWDLLVIPTLIDTLEDRYRPLRIVAARSLGSLGPRAWRAAPPLARAARDGDPRLATTAAEALRRIEGTTTPDADWPAFAPGRPRD